MFEMSAVVVVECGDAALIARRGLLNKPETRAKQQILFTVKISRP